MNVASADALDQEDRAIEAFASGLEVQSQHSAYTASQGSATSMNSNVIRLGTAPVGGLMWEHAIPNIIGLLCTSLAEFAELLAFCTNLGVHGVDALALYRPFENLFIKYLPLALASSTGEIISIYFSQSKMRKAIACFNYYATVSVLYSVLVILILTPAFPRYIESLDSYGSLSDTVVYGYVIFSLTPLLHVFSTAMDPFLNAENRTFLGLCKGMMQGVLHISILFFAMIFVEESVLMAEANAGHAGSATFAERAIRPTMLAGALSTTASAAIICIWMVLVFYRMPFLDMRVQGKLHFSLRRILHPNWRVVGRILYKSVPDILSSMPLMVGLILSYSLISHNYSDQTDLIATRAALFDYYLMYELASVVPRAFDHAFSGVCPYNVGAHLHGRVRQILVATALWSLAVSACVSAVLILLSQLATSAIHGHPPAGEDVEAYLMAAKDAALCGAIPPVGLALFGTVSSLLKAEQHYVLMIILQVARLICSIVIVLAAGLSIGDGANMFLALAVADLVPIGFGIIFLLYESYKYSHLAKVEILRKERQELEEQLTGVGPGSMDPGEESGDADNAEGPLDRQPRIDPGEKGRDSTRGSSRHSGRSSEPDPDQESERPATALLVPLDLPQPPSASESPKLVGRWIMEAPGEQAPDPPYRPLKMGARSPRGNRLKTPKGSAQASGQAPGQEPPPNQARNAVRRPLRISDHRQLDDIAELPVEDDFASCAQSALSVSMTQDSASGPPDREDPGGRGSAGTAASLDESAISLARRQSIISLCASAWDGPANASAHLSSFLSEERDAVVDGAADG